MNKLSSYEHEAIENLAQSDCQKDVILAQLAKATCISRDYTGVGLYTEISVDSSAPKLDEARWKIEDIPTGHAEHPEVPAGVGLILWFKNGYIGCLESFTYEGSWPQDETLFKLITNRKLKR